MDNQYYVGYEEYDRPMKGIMEGGHETFESALATAIEWMTETGHLSTDNYVDIWHNGERICFFGSMREPLHKSMTIDHLKANRFMIEPFTLKEYIEVFGFEGDTIELAFEVLGDIFYVASALHYDGSWECYFSANEDECDQWVEDLPEGWRGRVDDYEYVNKEWRKIAL